MNHVDFMGRFTRDPELRYTPQSKTVVSFTLAENRYGSNETDYIDCEAWEKNAEMIANSCRKGHRLLVWGRLKQDKWTDQQTQQPRSKVIISVTGFDFIEPPPQQGAQPAGGAPGYQQGQQPGYQQQPNYGPPGQGQPPGYVPPAGRGQYGQPPAGPGQQPGGYHGQPGQGQSGTYQQGPGGPPPGTGGPQYQQNPGGPPPGPGGYPPNQGQQPGYSGSFDNIPF